MRVLARLWHSVTHRSAIVLAVASITLLSSSAAANAWDNTAPSYTLLVCSLSSMQVVSFQVQGYNQFGNKSYQMWSPDQTWDNYDGHSWNCAWTLTNVLWLWQPRFSGTDPSFLGGDPDGAPQVFFFDPNGLKNAPVITAFAGVQAFRGTSGWYDNSGSYYACFLTYAAQQSC